MCARHWGRYDLIITACYQVISNYMVNSDSPNEFHVNSAHFIRGNRTSFNMIIIVCLCACVCVSHYFAVMWPILLSVISYLRWFQYILPCSVLTWDRCWLSPKTTDDTEWYCLPHRSTGQYAPSHINHNSKPFTKLHK